MRWCDERWNIYRRVTPAGYSFRRTPKGDTMRYRLKVTVIALCLGKEYTFTKTISRATPNDTYGEKKRFIDGIRKRGYEIKTIIEKGGWLK